jgi:chorismate synthase
MAGAVARKLLRLCGAEVVAHTVQVGEVKAAPHPGTLRREDIDSSPARCADPAVSKEMLRAIRTVEAAGDSIGGVVEVLASGVPGGLGEPLFDTLEGELAKAFFAIPAARAVEFGTGFAAASMKGSEHNDRFALRNRKVVTLTNHAGGISGGISNGMPIVARIAFKPTASIGLEQRTLNLGTGKAARLAIKGRHDSCIVPRAVPVVEAMAAIVLCDFALAAGAIGRVIK